MSHTLNLLGETLAELAPLIKEAVRSLDKPGNRALRRKIDNSFHFAVTCYGVLRREATPESAWERMVLPQYDRAIPVWPGRLAHEAGKARGAAAGGAPRARGHLLRLVVDNGQSVEAVKPTSLGGAA